LLWVGRLDSNKDPLTVLTGFERATAALPNAALTLVYGDDALLPEIKSRLDRSPVLREKVQLRGRVGRRTLASMYAAADVFVLGSHREVACFSLIEALSFGLTPIVTDIPAFRRLTDGGRLGALFLPGNAEEFARALRQLSGVDFSAQRRSVLAYFERELSWEVVGKRALEICRGAANARRGAGARGGLRSSSTRSSSSPATPAGPKGPDDAHDT
jgi:glycosyltransferase involved in cell wall biosynthesis